MKYKVVKGSELYDELIKLRKRMRSVNKEALDYAHTLGFDSIIGDPMALAGGITGFAQLNGNFNTISHLWRKRKYGRIGYYPKKVKVNKPIFDKLRELPIVPFEDYNNLIKYNWQKHSGNGLYFHPSLQYRRGCVLIALADECRNYKPVKGMIEILGSEFTKLQGKK